MTAFWESFSLYKLTVLYTQTGETPTNLCPLHLKNELEGQRRWVASGHGLWAPQSLTTDAQLRGAEQYQVSCWEPWQSEDTILIFRCLSFVFLPGGRPFSEASEEFSFLSLKGERHTGKVQQNPLEDSFMLCGHSLWRSWQYSYIFYFELQMSVKLTERNALWYNCTGKRPKNYVSILSRGIF